MFPVNGCLPPVIGVSVFVTFGDAVPVPDGVKFCVDTAGEGGSLIGCAIVGVIGAEPIWIGDVLFVDASAVVRRAETDRMLAAFACWALIWAGVFCTIRTFVLLTVLTVLIGATILL